MAEYIERKKVYADIGRLLIDGIILPDYEDGWNDATSKAMDIVQDFPATDVRPERHGRNITEMNPVDEFVCSECGFIMRDTSGYDEEEEIYYEFELKFCPKCGAKMDGKDGGQNA